MKRFYLEYKDEEILPPAVTKFSWTHNIMLIEKIKDKNIRLWYANDLQLNAPSIGLLFRKSKDKLTVEYSLKGVDKPIGVSSYEISKYLPKDILESLHTEEDINLHIELEEINDNNE